MISTCILSIQWVHVEQFASRIEYFTLPIDVKLRRQQKQNIFFAQINL